MPNLELTDEVVREIRNTENDLLNELVDSFLFPTLDTYSIEELSGKAWHWIREVTTGRELVLWIPFITENGTVFALNPGQPGDVPEVEASNAEFIDRDPVDTTHQEHIEVIEHEAES